MARFQLGVGEQELLLKKLKTPKDINTIKTAVFGVRHYPFDAVADCVTTYRVGNLGDGGKWLCNDYKLKEYKPCVVYSVGVGDDITFDQQLAAMWGCEVHIFDPAPSVQKRFAHLKKSKKYLNGSVTYHPWALGPVSDDPKKSMELIIEDTPCEVKTLEQIAKELGHQRVDLLKVDIEGGEWAFVNHAAGKSSFKKFQIKQFLVELHLTEKTDSIERVMKVIESMARQDFYLFRKEFNPRYAHCCAEYSFAERDYLLDLDRSSRR